MLVGSRILAAASSHGQAHLAELVDALDLGSSGFGRGGSSPPVGIGLMVTNFLEISG